MEKRYLEEVYFSRINKVIDYIEKNLSKTLSLEELASVANFSQYHFHRIFSSLIGETLFQFIQRIRLEKAANNLISDPKKTISEIAILCGFSSSATFARAFNENFKMSASEYRSNTLGWNSNTGKKDSNTGKRDSNFRNIYTNSSWYFCSDNNNIQKWRYKMNKKDEIVVEVKELEEMTVAYVRHIGPYAGDGKLFEGLYNKLFSWAGPRGLIQFPKTKSLSVYHDDPNITEESKLRTSICITVPEDTKVDGEIGKMKISAGKYAVGKFEINEDEFAGAWNTVYGSWMPQSGYQPDDGPCFEICHNNPKEHPEGKFIVSICVPVKPI